MRLCVLLCSGAEGRKGDKGRGGQNWTQKVERKRCSRTPGRNTLLTAYDRYFYKTMRQLYGYFPWCTQLSCLSHGDNYVMRGICLSLVLEEASWAHNGSAGMTAIMSIFSLSCSLLSNPFLLPSRLWLTFH